MKLSIDAPGRHNLIRGYSRRGRCASASRLYAASVIVNATTVIERWRPRAIERARPRPISSRSSRSQPEVLLLGTGRAPGVPAPRRCCALLYARESASRSWTRGAACRTYNVLVAEGRAVAAALIV